MPEGTHLICPVNTIRKNQPNPFLTCQAEASSISLKSSRVDWTKEPGKCFAFHPRHFRAGFFRTVQTLC